MAKKLEFDAVMNIDDAVKSLEGLEKKAEQSFKRIQNLSNKQTQKNQEAAQLRLRADESLKRQAQYKQLAQNSRGSQKKTYQNEANLWAEDARAANAGAKEAEKAASDAGKEIAKEVAEYNRLGEAIKTCRDRIAELANAEAQGSADARNAERQQREAQYTDALKRAVVGAGNGVSTVFEGIYNSSIRAGKAMLGTLSSGLQKVASLAMTAARSGLKALWSGLQKIASMAVNAAKTLGGALINGLKAVGSAALNAGKSILGLNKRHRDLGSGLKHGFMTVLKYAFGIRSLYFLFRRLRTALTDSIKTFAQHDAATMGSLNRLSAALNTLKASFGAAFAPVLNAVAPILEKLINMCTMAANAIAALFSALSGGKTFKVATAGANNLANATGGAAKQAKELKTQLAGFDELEVLSEDKNSDSGGGGGSVAYEDMEIPDWAAKIKEMIDNGQWEDLADMLTNKLNEIVDNVDWEGIGDKIGYWLNAAFTFGARALTGFDWYNLSAHIGDMLNHVMYGVNWENLGKLLVGKLYIMLRSLAGFFDSFDWAYFTRSLYDALRGALLGIDWVQVNKDFVSGLANVFGGIADGLSDINFGDLGEELTKRMQQSVEEIDWFALGNSISAFLHEAIKAATDFLQHLDPSTAAMGLTNFFEGVFGSIKLDTLINDLGNFLITVIDNATSFVNSLGIGRMGESFTSTIGNALSSAKWGEITESASRFLHTMLSNASSFLKGMNGGDVAEGIMTFITNVLTNLNVSQLAQDISDLFKNSFEFATEFLKGIDVGKLAENIKTFVRDFVNGVDWKGIANDTADFLITAFNTGTALLKQFDFGEMGRNFYDWIKDVLSTVDWGGLATSFMTFLGEAIGGLGAFLFEFIKSAVYDAMDFLKSYATDENGDGYLSGKEIWNGICKGVVAAVKNIGTWIKENIWTPFINGIKSAFGIHSPAETMEEPGKMIGEGLLEGIGGVFKAISDWINEHIFDPIVKGAKDGINAIKEVFSNVGETVGNAIDSGKQFVASTWDNFIGIFKDKKPEVYPTEEAREFTEATRSLNEAIGEEKNVSIDAKQAYDQLNSTITTLKGKSNLTRAEMELLLQSERMLTDLTSEYGNELERQGMIVDQNASSVQNAANAVTEEANAVTTASIETQNLNATVNDSNIAYASASGSATDYGTKIESASTKSEASAQRVEASAQTIENSMTESVQATAQSVVGSWDEIESRTVSFSDTMRDAITNVINVVNSFAVELTANLQNCVSAVVSAVSEMVRAWNTDWGTPHFHMPIFSMSGVFDLQTGQTPQVVISGWQWMAKGGIIDGATLIGAGEDGKEAIIPLERNTEWIDMVAEGLVNKLTSSRVVNELADAFLSVPMPTLAMGGIAPPNAFYGRSESNSDSVLEELKELMNAVSMLASQPIQLSTELVMDRRSVGKAVTEYQRSEARMKG